MESNTPDLSIALSSIKKYTYPFKDTSSPSKQLSLLGILPK